VRSNAEWTGFPLPVFWTRRANRTGWVRIGARAPIAACRRKSQTPGSDTSLARSIPRDKVDGFQLLIAYPMNGRELTPDHG